MPKMRWSAVALRAMARSSNLKVQDHAVTRFSERRRTSRHRPSPRPAHRRRWNWIGKKAFSQGPPYAGRGTRLSRQQNFACFRRFSCTIDRKTKTRMVGAKPNGRPRKCQEEENQVNEVDKTQRKEVQGDTLSGLHSLLMANDVELRPDR